MRRFVAALAAVLAVVVVGWSIASADTPSSDAAAKAGPVVLPPDTPPLAIVITAPGGGRSDLYFVAPTAGGDDSMGRPLSSLGHLAEGNVRAAMMPGSTMVLANAPIRPGRDVSFNGGLFALGPGETPHELCRSVVHASRPLITEQGRIFVARGRAGAPPTDPRSYRRDRLTVEEVDLASGALRTIHAYQGYLVHLAGFAPPELLLYRTGADGADLVAVDVETGALRMVVPDLLPFARDFSVDAARGVLVFRGRHESDRRRWLVERVEIASGERQRLYEGRSYALSPHLWPGGAVAFNPDGRGLALLGSSESVTHPLGPGVDVLRDVSRDERFVALLHTVAGRLPQPFVIDRAGGKAHRIEVPAPGRVAIAGFVEAAEVSP